MKRLRLRLPPKAKAVTSRLNDEFNSFDISLKDRIRQEIAELKESIQYQIDDFDEQLAAIRVDLDMDIPNKNLTIPTGGQEVGLEEFMSDMIGGAIVGGSASAAAVFVASRFIALLGGPLGWGLAILSTLGAALWALASNTSAADKVKNEFAEAAKSKMREMVPAFTSEVSKNLAEKLHDCENYFVTKLEMKMKATKEPIEEAIRLLKENQGNIDAQKQTLDTFKAKFASILERGEKLLAEM